MIDRYGADALRFALARAATRGQQDIPMSEEAIEGGRNFANKIWNAARLVLAAHPGGAPELPPPDRWTLPERWLLSRHEACLAEVDAALDDHRFAEGAQALYRFLWSEFCDWGLELEKDRLEASGAERSDAAAVLTWVLERTLRMLHPTMPFVTEEVWQRIAVGSPDSIAVAEWPLSEPTHADPEAETTMTLIQEIVTAIRRFRARHGISPKERFDVLAEVPAGSAAAVLLEADSAVRLAGVRLGVVADGAKPEGWTSTTFDTGAVMFPPGLFDADAERARLSAQRDGVDRDLARSAGKLANDGFRAKADAEVVEAERAKHERLTAQLAEIDAQLAEL